MKTRVVKTRDRAAEAEVSEIFSSLQGEGPYLGVKQIFVRFGRCNMHCGYCDETDKMAEGRFSVMGGGALLSQIERLEASKGRHHSVSLTGGEPLFYAAFLKNWLPGLKARAFRTYLETNGTLPQELAEVLPWCDVVAMDLKPASSTGDRDYFREHRAFLDLARAKEVFVKVVVTPRTRADEIVRCVETVKDADPGIPFIFQPLSDPLGINTRSLELIEKEFFHLAQKHLADVRVIPQMHKIWGVR